MIDDIDVSMWVVVDLPDDLEDSVLTLEISSDIASFSGVINEIKFGDKSDLLIDIVKDSWLSIVFSFVLIFGGLLLVVISFFIRFNQDNRLMSLGLIFLTSGTWILSEGKVMQFFVGNRLILGAISYAMIVIMPIIILQYLHDAVFTVQKNRRTINILSWGYVLLLLLIFVFEANGFVPYIVFMRWTLIYIVGSALLTSAALVNELVKMNNQSAMRHIKYIAVLLVSVAIEIGVFYLELFSFTSFFILIGFIVFLGLLMYDTFIYFKETYVLEKENELLAEMVFIDQLTGGKNRTAYERDLENILEGNGYFRLVVSDLNGLKYINDNYGHHSGDLALQSMFNVLEKAFKECGECYRLSGDEMVVLMTDTDQDLFESCIDKLGVLLSDYAYEFPLKVAIGLVCL